MSWAKDAQRMRIVGCARAWRTWRVVCASAICALTCARPHPCTVLQAIEPQQRQHAYRQHTVGLPFFAGRTSILEGDAVAVLPDALTFALGAIASEQRAAQRAKHWTQAPQDQCHAAFGCRLGGSSFSSGFFWREYAAMKHTCYTSALKRCMLRAPPRACNSRDRRCNMSRSSAIASHQKPL